MHALDATTLMMVNAVFNGIAAVAWCLLAGFFRVAPTASWLMAAAHLTRIFSLRCVDCLPGGSAQASALLSDLAALATIALLALAVRRMLRLRQRWQSIAVVTALAAVAIIGLALADSDPRTMLIAASIGMALLALGATRDIVSGAGPGLAPWLTGLMALPFLMLAAVSGARAVALGLAPEFTPLFLQQGRSTALLGWIWLLLSMAISTSLAALLLRRLILRIAHLTRRDSMTDILNRRALGIEMAALQQRQERGQGYAIVLVDIDHFKRINDQFGHAAGDAALLHCVAVLRSCLREVDLFGRQGGEEFCALLPHTRLNGAALVAERMRAALQAQPLVWREHRLTLTASFGVACAQSDDPQGQAGLALADRQVYRAKAEGRNRVCKADEVLG